MKTVEQASGLTIDHYLEVSFAGFVKMVNAIDGVDVCTPAEIYDPPSGLQLPAGRSTSKAATPWHTSERASSIQPRTSAV